MCGIVGLRTWDDTAADADTVRAMADRLRHRGPDGASYYCSGGIALGHRRLAIIDVEGGVQPLANEDETVWVTFNGEIYNFRALRDQLLAAGHRFRTRSDTEVLVHAYEEWGEACVERLRGMFAFAVWDERRQQLFLARDRVGIKPLVYAALPGAFAFASELQALQALPGFAPTLDLEALDLYLHFQYIPAPFSIYREVRKLPPAHYLVVDREGRLRGPVRYWDLTFRPDRRPTEAEWVERLDAALHEAVETHLVSDVPFGALLSGGVDSSLVVAHMSRVLEQPVRTFSIAFENEAYDESTYAREVARQFHTEHHEEVVCPQALDVLPELVRHYGEPFADSSAVPTYYVARMAAGHVKMVLSGDGGDENFAGYRSYASLAWEHRQPNGLGRRLRRGLGDALRAAGLRPGLASPADTWYESQAYFTPGHRELLWRPDYRGLLDSTRAWFDGQLRGAPAGPLSSRFQYLDIKTYLPNDILAKVDVASMCHGLEVRVPLLDHEFMELAAQVPPELKLRENPVSNGQAASWSGKYILKKTAERYFSREFLQRPKRGFALPIGPWFAGPWSGQLEERLLGPRGGVADFFEASFVKRLLAEHAAGQQDHARRLWALLFLEEWLRQQRDWRPAQGDTARVPQPI